jgi:hypothetical protein
MGLKRGPSNRMWLGQLKVLMDLGTPTFTD